MPRHLVALALAISLLALAPAPLQASLLDQQPERTVRASPGSAVTGQSVVVRISGFTAPGEPGALLCVGILGPGQNLEQGLSPSFRLGLGQIAVGSDGTGEAQVQVPPQLASGTYRLIVGGCPPQTGLAPFAALAETELTVVAGGLQTTYYFAEGATAPPFDTWLLTFNPNGSPATATVTFFGEGVLGTRTLTMAPFSRASLYVNEVLPNASFGMRVDSNLPIAAERAMYFRQDGTVVSGIGTPSIVWLFGEGSTAFPHETWFLLANPNRTTATVVLNFQMESGASRRLMVEVPPQSRSSVFANTFLPPTAFATRIVSSVPIVAERSMFRADTGSGSAAAGVRSPSPAWFFAEGSTQQPFDTWFLLYNPNPNPVRVLMRVYQEREGPGPLLDFTMPGSSRRSLFMNQVQANVGFGATITSEGGGIVAERSMFFRSGSTATEGATALASRWFFAEGATAQPFDTWVLLVNPSGRDSANVRLTFYFPDGTSASRQVVVGGEGRASVFLNGILPPTAVSTLVESDMPIVAERSMYFGQGGTAATGVPQ